jgi:hypothetical protein
VKGVYKQNMSEDSKFREEPQLAGTSPRARGNHNMFAGLEVNECEEFDDDWPVVGEVAYVSKAQLKSMKHKGNIDKGGKGKMMDEECRPCFAAMRSVRFASCRAPPGLGVSEEVGINAVEMGWKKFGVDEITIDSAAEESVCPRSWAVEFGTRPSDRKMKFVNASGGEMGHYGERVANFKTVGESEIMSLTFQVSDVKKPLAAVRRISEKGNKVVFGPEGNYIENVATGKRIQMTKRGGSYVVPAELLMKEAAGFTRQAC